MVGSGPFKFVKEEFDRATASSTSEQGLRAAQGPCSWASGGKVVKVDRVEWLYIATR
jgi:peptide/nickel transport system substrate-binding protein